MAGYTKLFSRILDSTIWREDSDTKVLWITMLAMADQDGVVHATIPGLADRARVSIEKCEDALARFQEPDKYSWSKEEAGRRVRVVEGGWFLINHAKYRALMGYEEQKEKTRLRVARHRALTKAALLTVTPVTNTKCNDNIRESVPLAVTESEEVKGGVIPADLHPLQYATKLMEEIQMPETRTNKETVAAVIKTLMKEQTGPAAYSSLLAYALDAIEQGAVLDKFWFEDQKWKGNGNGTGLSKKQQLVNKNRQAIIDGLGLSQTTR